MVSISRPIQRPSVYVSSTQNDQRGDIGSIVLETMSDRSAGNHHVTTEGTTSSLNAPFSKNHETITMDIPSSDHELGPYADIKLNTTTTVDPFYLASSQPAVKLSLVFVDKQSPLFSELYEQIERHLVLEVTSMLAKRKKKTLLVGKYEK